MTDVETLRMMRRCSEEIKQLRARIAYLEPRAQGYEAMVSILGMMPSRPQGSAEDLAWRLDKDADALERKLSEPATTAPEAVPQD